MSTVARTRALIGDLSITTSNGVTLTGRTDVGLAKQWARVEVDLRDGEGAFDRLTLGHQTPHIAEALTELRRAYAVGTGE